jgi:hypothetical protein
MARKAKNTKARGEESPVAEELGAVVLLDPAVAEEVFEEVVVPVVFVLPEEVVFPVAEESEEVTVAFPLVDEVMVVKPVEVVVAVPEVDVVVVVPEVEVVPVAVADEVVKTPVA